jgi:hypothetical protein
LATFSSVLSLKLNDPSDPFQLSDFVSNFEILDASPGTFICTSTSRPNWGTAQKGRMIFMTDLKQLSYWTGTAWADLRDSVPVFAGGNFVNTAVNPGAQPNFNILTFTTPRPCALTIILSATYQYPNKQSQDAFQSIVFDGVEQLIGGYAEQIRFSGNSSDAAHTAGQNATSIAVVPNVAAGQHKIGLRINVTSDYSTAIQVKGAKAIALISNYNSGNVL